MIQDLHPNLVSISTRAPRTEGDRVGQSLSEGVISAMSRAWHFNPRPPHGGRR